MTCYNETRDKNAPLSPRVERDGANVREIAEDAPCFLGHVRPRRYVDRDSNDGHDTEE